MSASTARVQNHRTMDRKPVPQQRAERAEQAREFEVSRKSRVKRAALKVVGFFKKVASKVVSSTKNVALTVARSTKSVALKVVNKTKSVAKFVAFRVKASPMGALRAPLWFVMDQSFIAYRFTKSLVVRYWAQAAAVVALGAATLIAPSATIIGTAFVVVSYGLAKVDSPFARFMSHVFFRAGVEAFVEGLVFSVLSSNRR